jgi:hypothetical protein
MSAEEVYRPPKRLPEITGPMFLGILFGMTIFTFGIAGELRSSLDVVRSFPQSHSRLRWSSALFSIEGTPKRTEKLKPNQERVLILGASS